MKKKVTEDRTFCDICETNESHYQCLSCGKDICYDCLEMSAKEYKHSVHCSGSGDGLYCRKCDAKLIVSGGDKLHKAYRAIESLRNEETCFYADFKLRADKAEHALKVIQGR